jgi:hypothetical protein
VPPYIPACDRTFALPTNSGKPAHEVLLRRVALLSGKSDGCSVRLDAAAARLESAGSTAACLPKRKRKLAPKLPTRRHVAWSKPRLRDGPDDRSRWLAACGVTTVPDVRTVTVSTDETAAEETPTSAPLSGAPILIETRVTNARPPYGRSPWRFRHR